jgi:hypothetical protein
MSGWREQLAHLAPGEERRYTLEIGALAGAGAIDACADRIGSPAEEEQHV